MAWVQGSWVSIIVTVTETEIFWILVGGVQIIPTEIKVFLGQTDFWLVNTNLRLHR